MKYIVTKKEDGTEEIFMFSRNVPHDCMAETLYDVRNQMRGNWQYICREPVSAGFVSEKMECYGESETLKLKSRKQDTQLLRKQLEQRS